MRCGRRPAYSSIYVVIAFTALSGFVSLGVDYGRVQLANAELQNATDAAARYATKGLSDGTAIAKAQSVATQNRVDGTALVLQSSDVEAGYWNSTAQTFTAGGSPSNAVRITGRRTSSRGTATPLLFARLLGMNSCDLTSVSIATAGGASPYNIVGLTSVTLSGSGKIRRDPAESGTVEVAGNGSWSLSWGQQILGNVYYRGSAPSTPNGANCITGTTTQMGADLAFTAPTVPSGATALGAVNFSGGTYSVGAGDYSASTVTLGGGATINVTGDVNLYCSGAVDVANGVIVNTSGTSNKFTIYQTSASTANFNVGTIYCRVYAPNSTVTVGGSTQLIGSIVAKNLSVPGTVSYNSALPIPTVGAGSGTISYVK